MALTQVTPILVERKEDHNAGERMALTIQAVEYAFRWCPPGTFTMGSPANETGRYGNETQHQVTLTRGFWMLETEVTQAMWEKVMGNNPSDFKGGKLPVDRVSWYDCQAYIKRLNELGAAPKGYRFSLPTESQWEYACRAGTATALNSGKDLTAEGECPHLDELSWYSGNSEGKTHEAGQKRANAWGLYDMHGNVCEWCLDWHGMYPSGNVTDPIGNSGAFRVIRGGDWDYSARYSRSAYRYFDVPTHRHSYFGLRLVLVASE